MMVEVCALNTRPHCFSIKLTESPNLIFFSSQSALKRYIKCKNLIIINDIKMEGIVFFKKESKLIIPLFKEIDLQRKCYALAAKWL